MNQRDIEQLSVYLDGGLGPSDAARLETRLASDPALASALDALRETRALLRQMPRRRAPRNFTLTRQMVGKNPPLPRAYPILRFAAAAAAFLFALSFLDLRPFGFGAAAPAPAAYAGEEAALATEEAPMLQMTIPETEAAPQATAIPPKAAPLPSEDANHAAKETPSSKATGESVAGRPLLSTGQIALAAIAILSAASMFLMRRLAARKWRAR